MTTRVGVVADTHCPEFLDDLPDRLFDVLAGVDLILHAGDIDSQDTLTALGRLAPVEAVRGDHDRSLVNLPSSRDVTVEGKRIVVVHGQRSRWLEEPNTLLWTLSLGYFRPHRGLPRALRRRFPYADAIVYGHTHRARAETVEGILLFNPGGVHQWNRTTATRRLTQHPGWFEWCWLQVARHLRRYEEPSVGILEIGDSGITPRVIAL
ncbi:MAG TPA: YfcE family phosphodiesterase [Candidatus Dormibacteraeota bacterium]|nr:YfcE family phosphodiesterase [Candidatus Dormibacteraeota bacterium]